MTTPRPFSAASSKLAYAQVFAGPSARSHPRPTDERRHVPTLRRRPGRIAARRTHGNG